jgi:hypothetical protein
MGHDGHPCLSPDAEEDSESDEEINPWFRHEEQSSRRDVWKVLFVTTTGLFSRQVIWCRCPARQEKDLQLLEQRFFSATAKHPSMAFTMDVLENFHLDAMECKTSAFNFYSKLRHLSSGAFPKDMPVWSHPGS